MPNEEFPTPSFDAQINVKMSRELRVRLQKIELKHGTPASEILRRLGTAAAEFFEENGYLTFPASIVPETFFPAIQRKLRARSSPPSKKI